MSTVLQSTDKFDAEVDPKKIKRFSRDCVGGPSVSFAQMPNGTLLILVKGRRVLLRESHAARKLSRSIVLRYTTAEWEAFILGVRAGEFDGYTSGAQKDLIPMRDSKDPDGPILALTVAQITPFIDAIRSGKYNLPPSSQRV